MCHHRAFLPDSWVSSGPWETGERGRLQELSILKYRVQYLLNPSKSHLELCLPSNEHAHGQSSSRQSRGLEGIWDDLCEHFGFSFTTLLSHMLRMGNHIKNKPAVYLEANYYQMTMLQDAFQFQFEVAV